jgi:hypothetical protein
MPNIEVEYDQLPKYAQYWDENASIMREISQESGRLEYREDAGIFAGFVGLYNEVCGDVSRLCEQGCVQMQRIAQALMSAYNTYVETEAKNYQLSHTIISKLQEH